VIAKINHFFHIFYGNFSVAEKAYKSTSGTACGPLGQLSGGGGGDGGGGGGAYNVDVAYSSV
jgi:hypothetical protein